MSRELFIEWLCSIGEKQPNYCYINSEKYKSFVFKNLMPTYIEHFTPIYKNLDVSTYKKCMNVFRNLSKKFTIHYEYKIRYVNSTYYIDYYFTPLNI
jgi:hypothetical protein